MGVHGPGVNVNVQSERDRDAACNTREETKQLIQSTQIKTNQTQNEVMNILILNSAVLIFGFLFNIRPGTGRI